MEIDCSDSDMCGRRFHRNCRAEFNETWYNNSIEGVVNARSRFLKSGHATPPGRRFHFSKNIEFYCSDCDMCGRRFHKNCKAEFNETYYNDSIGGAVNARSSIIKIKSFSAP